MGELFYFTINVHSITEEDAQKIIDFVLDLRGTRSGMSISYDEPI